MLPYSKSKSYNDFNNGKHINFIILCEGYVYQSIILDCIL